MRSKEYDISLFSQKNRDGGGLKRRSVAPAPASHTNKNIFKGVTLHLLARIIACSPAPMEIKLI
jgi:hypothetical protein